MATTTDAVVIGAGVVGSATSLALARRGWSVIVIDKLPTCGYGATAASSAIVHPCYRRATDTALALESHHLWRQWPSYIGGDDVDERGLARYINCGAVALCGVEDHEHRLLLDRDFQQRCACRPLTRQDIDWQHPYFETMGSDSESWPRTEVFDIGAAGYVDDPQLATHNLMRAAERAGARFRFGERVDSIERGRAGVDGVTLDSGDRLSTKVVVNAAGPHSAQVNALAGVDAGAQVSTRAVRQEVANIPLDFEEFGIVLDLELGIYLREASSGKVLVGFWDPPAADLPSVDPDHFEPYLTDWWKQLIERARTRMGSLDVPTERRGIVELYDLSDDGVPLYDCTELQGYFLANGTSGHHFKVAPLIGELMAQIVESAHGGRRLDESPIEFALEHCGIAISSADFSRLRTRRSPSIGAEA